MAKYAVSVGFVKAECDELTEELRFTVTNSKLSNSPGYYN